MANHPPFVLRVEQRQPTAHGRRVVTLPHAQNAEVVFAKTFASEIMLSVIWYRNTFYVTISPAAQTEQALVDTLFPNIYGKQRSLQVRP